MGKCTAVMSFRLGLGSIVRLHLAEGYESLPYGNGNHRRYMHSHMANRRPLRRMGGQYIHRINLLFKVFQESISRRHLLLKQQEIVVGLENSNNLHGTNHINAYTVALHQEPRPGGTWSGNRGCKRDVHYYG